MIPCGFPRNSYCYFTLLLSSVFTSQLYHKKLPIFHCPNQITCTPRVHFTLLPPSSLFTFVSLLIEPPASQSSNQITKTLLFPSLLLSNAPIPAIIPLHFLGSVVTPDYVSTSKDSERRTTDKRVPLAFVFLGLGYPTQHDLFQFHPLIGKFHDFVFSL